MNGALTQAKEVYNITPNKASLAESVLSYKVIRTGEVFAPFKSEGADNVYSLLCLKTDENFGVEYDFVYDVTRNLEYALYLANLLCKNEVTPCTLRDVIEDLI